MHVFQVADVYSVFYLIIPGEPAEVEKGGGRLAVLALGAAPKSLPNAAREER